MLELNRSSRVELIREALDKGASVYPVEILKVMDQEEVQEVFAELLPIAAYDKGSTKAVHEIILNLPREWVLANIEKYAQPLLDIQDLEDYRGLLELYRQLDKDLTLRLINQALQTHDRDMIELAEFVRERLAE
jgi:hypothetical protein